MKITDEKFAEKMSGKLMDILPGIVRLSIFFEVYFQSYVISSVSYVVYLRFLKPVVIEKLDSNGIKCKATKVFQQGPFFVVRLNLIAVDLQKLLIVKAGEQKLSTFNEIKKILGGQWVEDTISSSILPLISNKMQEILPEKFNEKLGEKGIQSDITVLRKEEQAEFFYDALTTLKV